MYVILVNDDNTLTTTKRERIMQRSKMVDELWFLVNPMYKKVDMSLCTVHMEYVLPISKKYKDEILVMSEENYKDHLKYVLPFDTSLTAEAGEIEVQLTFIYVNINPDGKSVQYVRKTSPTTITIVPISAWSDIIPDEALTSLDQKIMEVDTKIKALNDIANIINNDKADDISYDLSTGELQLKSGDKLIGSKVTLYKCDCDENGVPIVDISTVNDDVNKDGLQTEVVLF